MCSLRSSRRIWDGSPVLSMRRDCVTSKLVQSSAAAPAAASRTCGCARGGRGTGCGAGGGASPPSPPAAGSTFSSAMPEAGAGTGGSAGGGAGSGGAATGPLAGGGPSVSGLMADPGTPLTGSLDCGMRASRGCCPRRPDLRSMCVRYSSSNHRHSPGLRLWSACALGRGGAREQPGHRQGTGLSPGGIRHWPGMRVCRGSEWTRLALQPGQLG